MKNEKLRAAFASQVNNGCKRKLLPVVGIMCIAGAALAAQALRGSGTFAGRATVADLGGGLKDLNISVTGIVTHLGKSKVQIHTVADFSGPLPTPIPPSTGTIEAANGDTISFTLRWTLQEESPGVFDTVGPFTITGGTGRFAGASGGGDYLGTVNTINGDVTAAITGEVNR